MASTTIILKGWKEYEQKLKKSPELVTKTMDAQAAVSANAIANGARTRAPHNIGHLRATINAASVKLGDWRVTVASDYAAYVEFGTKSKVQIPSGLEQYASQFRGSTGQKGAKEAIYRWCADKGIPQDRWWNIYIHIMIYGIRAQPFLFPSVEEERPRFYDRVKKALDAIT